MELKKISGKQFYFNLFCQTELSEEENWKKI